MERKVDWRESHMGEKILARGALSMRCTYIGALNKCKLGAEQASNLSS